MSETKRTLCFSKTASNRPLCYKMATGDQGITSAPLIYKGGKETTIRVPWLPQSYTCHTYNYYHVIAFTASGTFTAGSGRILSQTDGGTEVVFKIKVEAGPATFEISASSSTPCAATQEDPGVKCNVFVNQVGTTPQMKKSIAVPRIETTGTPKKILVKFDAACKLVSIT